MARHNVEKYAKSPAITEFRGFLGRPHFLGAPGWEEVADHALVWATEHGDRRGAGEAGGRESIATA